jgi:hypothetical protein
MLLPDNGSTVSLRNVVYFVYISSSGKYPSYSLFHGSQIVIIKSYKTTLCVSVIRLMQIVVIQREGGKMSGHPAVFRKQEQARGRTVVKYHLISLIRGGPGSSVSIATGYGLDGPGIESRWGRDFPHLSRPTLGPTQPPVHWVPVFPGGRKRPGRDADPSPPSSAEV